MTDQKQTETSFHGQFGTGDDKVEAPELYIASIIKDPSKFDTKKFEAAKLLLPYRVPQLNRVDAVQRNVEMTHEEWIKSLEDGPAPDPENNPSGDDDE